MDKKNKIIFCIIIAVTLIILGLCIYSIIDKNNKKVNIPTNEVEVCTKEGC